MNLPPPDEPDPRRLNRNRDGGDRPLLGLLLELYAALDRHRDGNPPANPGGCQPEQWEDDENIYFEFVVPDFFDRDVDISTQNGRTLIRSGR